MKIAAMIDWSVEERAAKEKEWTQALFTLRLQKATGQLDNPMKIKEVRKDIARLKTLDNMPQADKEHAAEHAVGAAAPMASTATTGKPKSAEEHLSSKSEKGKRAAGPARQQKGKASARPAATGKAKGATKAGKKAAAAAAAQGHSPSKKKASSGKPKSKPAAKAAAKSKKKSK